MRAWARGSILLIGTLLFGLPPYGALVVLAATSPSGAAVGPSFVCAPGQDPLAQLICSDPDFARLDLQFAQAYEALRQQSATDGQHAVWQEQLRFHTAVLALCSIPASGGLTPAPSSESCAKQAYEKQRQQWLSRLSGSALEEASRSPEDHEAAQRALLSNGYLPARAQIDGVYGPATRAAIVAFQQGSDLPPTGLLGDRDLALLAGSTVHPRVKNNRDAIDIDAIPEVPPIAVATYAGKPVQLVHDDLTVTLDREPSDDSKLCTDASQATCKVVVARVTQGGQQTLSMLGVEVDDTEINLANARVELRSLDRSSSEPAVVFSLYSGGAHCCYLTKIAVFGADSGWKAIDAGPVDGDWFSFLDLLKTSETEIVHKDDRFDYAFGCYACSNNPTRAFRLIGSAIVDVSMDSAFHDYQTAILHRMERQQFAQADPQLNAYFAGWVAQKSLAGQLSDA